MTPAELTLKDTYKVGTAVLLSTGNLDLKVLSTGTKKLAPEWFGPFHITERMGPLNYRLELPDCLPVRDVFHVCYLKVYHDDGRQLPPPVPEVVDGSPTWEVDRIL